MTKFFGTPNMLVNIRKKVHGVIKQEKLFRFNEKGEYETDNIKIIEKLKKKFKFKEVKNGISQSK